MLTAPSHSATPRYRSDIDGLRAVAVLLVLGDHLGVRGFHGGYIGVDVFFVISGYLISTLLLRDIDAARFSIGRFYLRRFRRIAPALLAMLAATSAISYCYLFPSELKPFFQTLLGALLSCSNVVLLNQTDYFNAMRKLAPLLHTWSLGVEEQFYIVFPLILLLLCRWARRQLKLIVWLLTAAGFALCWYWTGINSSQAFYLAPLRAWEFLLGTLLALRALPALDLPWKRNLAAAFGLLLILAAGHHYQDWTPFPGWHALVPCLGAVLVIAAGESGSSVTGRLLSWGPIRGIGLISYSLYLWHWPIQVFQTTNNILVPDRYPHWFAETVVAAVSLAVATLSWRFIEQPFRNRSPLSGRLPLFAINGTVFALLLWFGVFILQHDGWPPDSVPHFAAYFDYAKVSPGVEPSRWDTCYMEPQNFPSHFKPSVCLADDPTRPHYLLLGDSHADSTYWGLKNAFPEFNISQINTTGCQPMMNFPAKFPECKRANDLIFNSYLTQHHFDTVLLVGRWHPEDMGNLSQTIDWLKQHGMQPVVFGPSIEFDQSLVRLIELSHREHDPGIFVRHRDHVPQQLDATMAALARNTWHVRYISMYQVLCHPHDPQAQVPEDPDSCPVYAAKGISLLFDTDHLSPPGSLFYAQAMRKQHQLP